MKAKLCSGIAATLMLAIVLAALPLTIPKLFGLQIYNLITPSMTPALPVGGVVYVQSCEPAALEAGDVITFTLHSGTKLVETHRVLQNDSDARQIITKGDANAEADTNPVGYDRVVGKVVFSLPVLGAISKWIHTGAGIAVCTAIFALAFILWTLADKIKKRESFK